MTARNTILRRLRNAHPERTVPQSVAPPIRPFTARPLGECVARFAAECALLGVECQLESTADAVRQRVASLVGDARVLAWDAEHLPYAADRVLPHPIRGGAARDRLATAEIGVTGCTAAIAETGSLAMISGPGRSRAVSLLPPVHVALVRREQLIFSMAEFLATHREAIAAAASCTFITGPSRTADIELTLTLGIHGPGRVVVVVGP